MPTSTSTKPRFGAALVAVLVSASPQLLSDSSSSLSEFVFTSAPFVSCHASTLVQLRDGSILTAWFGGSAEGKPDVAIWGAQRKGDVWSEPRLLVREPDIASFNPVLFHTTDERLWLYYKFGPHPTSWTAGRLSSRDEGQTWSPPEHLPAGIYGPIRAKPLVMPDGTIVSGTSVESYHSWASWVERSTDSGNTWSKFGPITVPSQYVHAAASATTENGNPFNWSETTGIIQPSVVSLGLKHLRFYARSTGNIGRICISDSKDDGRTWTPARPIDLPNPNSGIDAVALKDGRVLLVYNHTAKGRSPLNLALSNDGEKFRMIRVLESEPGEYSYPAMIEGKEGDIHITYTWNRKRIRYIRIAHKEIV